MIKTLQTGEKLMSLTDVSEMFCVPFTPCTAGDHAATSQSAIGSVVTCDTVKRAVDAWLEQQVATTTRDDRLRAYGVDFKTAGEIVSCSVAFPGFPSMRTFAHEAMYGSKGWKTKWSNDHSDSHYPIILGGSQLPNTADKAPNWTYAGVGVAAGYVPASPADIHGARSQGTTIPSGGLIRVICVTVDFVIPSRVIQAPKEATQPTQTMYTVVSGDTLSSVAERFKVAGGWQQLYRRNSGTIADPNHIYPGQVLVIP